MKKTDRIKKQQQLKISGLVRGLVIFAMVSGLITGLVSLHKFFTVKTIECQLIGSAACPDDLVQSLQFVINQPLFFVNYDQQLSVAQLPQPVRLIQLRKKLPHTLSLAFQLEPVAYLITTDQDSFPVSQTGQLYRQQFDQAELVRVKFSPEWSSQSATVDPFIHHSLLSIISSCQALKLPLKTITWLDNSTIQLSMENRPEIFIIDSQQPSLEIHRLGLVLQSSEYQELTEPKQELDLRFKMPVLRTEQ